MMHSTVLYCTLLYSTLLDSTRLYSTLLYFTLPYSTLLYSTVLYGHRRDRRDLEKWEVLLGVRLLGTTCWCGLSNHQAATAQMGT